ncbi:MAG TPA: PilZ domain-containing protein [Nitrospiraceae bacterium]|nr:PilZ domain-containing protein [Nitrospiraceae bacterium]
MTPQCPKCGKYFTKRVLIEGAEDPTSTMQGMYAYRCQLCSELFRARKPALQSTPAPQAGKEAELTNVTNRQYVRVNAKFPVTFVLSKLRQEGTITEIALGGCSLEANVVLAIGAKFRMDILISENEPPLVVDQALVRSVRPTGFGIQFMEFQETEKVRLGRVLEKLLAILLS